MLINFATVNEARKDGVFGAGGKHGPRGVKVVGGRPRRHLAESTLVPVASTPLCFAMHRFVAVEQWMKQMSEARRDIMTGRERGAEAGVSWTRRHLAKSVASASAPLTA